MADPEEDDDDDPGPPPMVIVRGPTPERTVAKIHGELSAAEAQRCAVSVGCGLDFSSRRVQTNAAFEQLRRPREPAPRQLSDEELLGGPAPGARAGLGARVDVHVEQGEALAAVSPAGTPHGIRLTGRSRCDGPEQRD